MEGEEKLEGKLDDLLHGKHNRQNRRGAPGSGENQKLLLIHDGCRREGGEGEETVSASLKR